MSPLRIWVAQITGLPASMQLGAGTGWDFDFAAPCESMGKSMEILLNARNVHCEDNAHPSTPHSKGFAKAAIRDSAWWGEKSRQLKVGGGRPPSWEPTNSLLASPLPPSSSPLYKTKIPPAVPSDASLRRVVLAFCKSSLFCPSLRGVHEKNFSHVLP